MQSLRMSDKHPSDMTWQFYLDAKSAWEAMYRECEEALHSIHFEQYIFRADAVGRRFMELFKKKVAEGVKVRLVIDAMGSAEFFLSHLPQELRKAGIDLEFFNPPVVRWRKWIDMLFPRDHSKIMIIDDKTVFTGGVCIDERMETWRDTHLRLRGDLVRAFSQHFDDLWRNVKLGKRYGLRKFHEKFGDFALIVSAGRKRRNAYYKELMQAINAARKEIYLTTPYFVPRRQFIRMLRKAMARGVRVSVMLSCQSNLPCLVFGRQAAGKILKAGGSVYMYKKCMLHNKTIVVDDAWAAVGSSNLDSLSFFHNREANIVTTDPAMIRELKEHFIDDISHAEMLTYSIWKHRPMREKFLSYFLKPMRHFL